MVENQSLDTPTELEHSQLLDVKVNERVVEGKEMKKVNAITIIFDDYWLIKQVSCTAEKSLNEINGLLFIVIDFLKSEFLRINLTKRAKETKLITPNDNAWQKTKNFLIRKGKA